MALSYFVRINLEFLSLKILSKNSKKHSALIAFKEQLSSQYGINFDSVDSWVVNCWTESGGNLFISIIMPPETIIPPYVQCKIMYLEINEPWKLRFVDGEAGFLVD